MSAPISFHLAFVNLYILEGPSAIAYNIFLIHFYNLFDDF